MRAQRCRATAYVDLHAELRLHYYSMYWPAVREILCGTFESADAIARALGISAQRMRYALSFAADRGECDAAYFDRVTGERTDAMHWRSQKRYRRLAVELPVDMASEAANGPERRTR